MAGHVSKLGEVDEQKIQKGTCVCLFHEVFVLSIVKFSCPKMRC